MNLLKWFKPGQQSPSVAQYNDAGDNRFALLVTNVDSSGATGTEVNIPDGQDITQGAIADAAVTTDASGTVNAHLRGIVALLAGILRVGGDVAHAAADSGNPVKIGGRYNTAAPTLTNGQRGNIQLDVNANLKITDPTVSKGAGVTDATTIRVVTATDGPSIAVLGTTTDAAVSTDANGSINAHIRGLIVLLVSVITTVSAVVHIKVGEQFQPTAEDNPNGVIATISKPLAVSTYVYSVALSAALEASRAVKASAGVLRSVTARLDSTAASGTYYLHVLNAASLPANGAVTHLVAPVKRIHVLGTDDIITWDLTGNGIYASTGIVIALSSTEFTLTVGGALLSITALYK